jgi:hypothetical protein
MGYAAVTGGRGAGLKFKLPPGFTAGARVVANARHAKVYRSSPRGRLGTVVRGMAAKDSVMVLWDGQKWAHPVPCNLLDVLVLEHWR